MTDSNKCDDEEIPGNESQQTKLQSTDISIPDQKHNKPSITDWITGVSTLVIMLATSVYTCFSYKQWNTMKSLNQATFQQLSVAKATLQDAISSGRSIAARNERLTKATEKSSEATKETADAMVDTVRQSRKSLDATINNFHLDQRAWIGATELTAILYDDEGGKKVGLKENQPFTTSITIVNTGKTPALNVHTTANVQLLKNGEIPIIELLTVSPTVTSNNTVMPSNKFYLIPRPINGINKNIIKYVNDREILVYLTAKITYDDVFGNPHYTKCCGILRPDLMSFDACSTGNEAN